jgi:NADPH:quinone reductase-like Zn-dependent oxidoreductase
MHAVQYQAYGGYQENRVVDLPVPMARDGEVLVQMRTVGVNPLDNTFRAGHHPAANAQNLPRIGGQTGVGVVVEKGQSSFAAGDRVIVFGAGFGRTADGTWREYVAASPAALSPVPAGVDDDTAAAFVAGFGYLTGYLALTEFARFQPGQTVLAPGIGGAVGMETVQIAARLGASMAISTASTTAKAQQALAAGYEHVIDLSRQSLRDGVMRLTDGKGVDVVVDGVGGPLAGAALGTLAFGGMLVSVGYAGGRKTEIDVTDLIWRAAKVRGFIFRPEVFNAETLAAAQNACRQFLAEGALQPTVAKVFPLTEAAEAVRFLIEDRPFGRVLMSAAP